MAGNARHQREIRATEDEPVPQSGQNAIAADLPEGWSHTRLANLAEHIQYGYTASAIEGRKGPRFLRITDIQDGVVDWDSVPTCQIDDTELQRFRLQSGDILFARTGATTGKSFLIRSLPKEAVFASYLIRVRPRTLVNPAFLSLCLQTPEYWQFISENVAGNAQPNCNATKLASLPLSIPPLAEQKRIVAKVEELLTHVNAARDHLAKVPKILKCFRQSVLAAACSGRLTEEWRKRNPSAESVSKIVEAIRKRRESGAKSAAQKERLLQIYENTEENDWSELPEGWGFVALNKLSASFDYGTSAKSQPSGKMPVLRMGNIQSGKIDWTDLVYTSDREEIRQYSLEPNTVLFNRTNSPELVGKTAIYRGERPAIFAGYLIRITHLPELDPQYLNFCLNTNYAREFCSHVKTDAVSQSNINAQKLGKFEVPYCPLSEQHEIVRRIEALFKLAETIEKRVEAATKRADKLTQAILGKAFRGELVPTEAELARTEGRDYETAQQLLGRIASLKAEPRKASRRGQADRNCLHGTLGIGQSVTMRTHNKESVLAAVAKMKSAEFSFDDLREAVPGDYESLKEIVFELLQQSDPTLTQRFDEDTSEMKLVRRTK